MAERERIDTIGAGQGARVTTRKNAGEAAEQARKNATRRYLERHPEARASEVGPERNHKNVLLLVLAAITVLVAVFLLVRCVGGLLGGIEVDDGDGQVVQDVATEDEAVVEDPESESAAADGALSYEGKTYAMALQENGSWGMVATAEDGSTTLLFYIEGTPAALARHKNVLLVAENRESSWDVVCFSLGGTTASYLVDGDGNRAGAEGQATALEVADTTLRVTTATGETVDYSLV